MSGLVGRQLEPVTHALLERAGCAGNEAVLDVGCGSGTTTLAAAADAGHSVGVDFSQPLVELARRRTLSRSADDRSLDDLEAAPRLCSRVALRFRMPPLSLTPAQIVS